MIKISTKYIADKIKEAIDTISCEAEPSCVRALEEAYEKEEKGTSKIRFGSNVGQYQNRKERTPSSMSGHRDGRRVCQNRQRDHIDGKTFAGRHRRRRRASVRYA